MARGLRWNPLFGSLIGWAKRGATSLVSSGKYEPSDTGEEESADIDGTNGWVDCSI